MNSKNTQRDYFEDEEEKRRSASHPRHKSERERLSNEETETFLSRRRPPSRAPQRGENSIPRIELENEEKEKKKETHSFGFDDDE